MHFPRRQGERNEDSYGERNRLSSAASTRTSQVRGSSDASTLLRLGKHPRGGGGDKYTTEYPSGVSSSAEMLTSLNPIILNPVGAFVALTPPQSPQPSRLVELYWD